MKTGSLEERFNKRIQWRKHRQEIMRKTEQGSYRTMEVARPSTTYNRRKSVLKGSVRKKILKNKINGV